MVLGATFVVSVLAIVWISSSGVCSNRCELGGYCWACTLVGFTIVFVMVLLPPAAGWLWTLKGRTESSAQHTDRSNNFMNRTFAAAALCMLWVAQLMITPTVPSRFRPNSKADFYTYIYHKQGDFRVFLIESCATILVVLLVGFWMARRRA